MGQIVTFLFVVLIIVSIAWSSIGILPGIILAVIALTTDDKVKKKKCFKWALICFSGIALLVVTFVLYFIVNLLSFFFFGVGLGTSIIGK